MKQSGRRSTASLAVVTTIRPAAKRLAAPAHLGTSARQAWREVVASRPPEFFDDASAPLLETFAVATGEHRRLSTIIATLDPLADIDTLAKITRLLDTHALRIGAAATKLRLSNQARFDAQRAESLSKGAGSSSDRVRANYARSQE